MALTKQKRITAIRRFGNPPCGSLMFYKRVR